MIKLVLATLLCGLALGEKAAVAGPVVLELFTSQSCSSCPPADALMAEYARTRPDLLPLDFHVDYWNRLNWRDPYSSPEATARQRDYASSLPSEVYTPELVVNGRVGVVGSDRAAVEQAIEAARSAAVNAPAVSVADGAPGMVSISLGAGKGSGSVVLVGFDAEHTTAVAAGENGGRTLHEANVVRGWRTVARWNGAPLHLEAARVPGQRYAVLVQEAGGGVIAASVLEPARQASAAR